MSPAGDRVTTRKAQKSARKGEKAARKACTTLEFFGQASFMADRQVGDFDCNTGATDESLVSHVSTVVVSGEHEDEPETKYEQSGATDPTNDCTKGLASLAGDACSIVQSNGAKEEPVGNENECVYYPCAPGAPLRKFWPVLVNGEQFYTDETQQLFKLASIPVLAASETCKSDSDERSTFAGEDGASTASDSDVMSWGVTMTRSHSEPSFPTRWLE